MGREGKYLQKSLKDATVNEREFCREMAKLTVKISEKSKANQLVEKENEDRKSKRKNLHKKRKN